MCFFRFRFLTSEYRLHNGDIRPIMNPGWTNYNKIIQYHTFDVTETLNDESNHIIGFIVAPGWYSGYIGPGNNHSFYGNTESVLFELHIEFNNGSKWIITSDDTWKVTTGPLIYSDLLHGEVFYEDRQPYEWMTYNYNDSNWSKVVSSPIDKTVEITTDNVAKNIRFTKVQCVDYWNVAENTWVYEYQQIVTGQIDCSVLYFSDIARIQVRYGEAIYPNGTLYSGYYGTTLPTDIFFLNGKF